MFHATIRFQRDQFLLDAKLHLNNGSITALIGASGSGKSSLFRVLSGLEKPVSGQIYSGNTCWFDAKKKFHLDVRNRKVGMVFQDYALFEHLTVYENIAYGVEKKAQSAVVGHWLTRIDLPHKAHVYPQALSGGEKQRVALARALAISPDILLLDEPFSALDTVIRHELRRELQTLISDTQIPVLIATHDLFEARFLADTVYVMDKGKIIQHGPTDIVFNQPETVQGAKMLGWQNILPILAFDADRPDCVVIKGKWGELAYINPVTHRAVNYCALAIPVDAFSVASPLTEASLLQSGNNPAASNFLFVTVTHVANMGDHFLVEAQLPGKNCIVLQQSIESPVTEGDELGVYVDLSRLILLSD